MFCLTTSSCSTFCRMRPWAALLFAVSLLNSCETQGSSAVTPVQKGDDLTLNVDADVPERFLFVEWIFNKTVILVRFVPRTEPIIFPDFTGRIEFPVKNFSVKLKNLQEADSGVYAARVVPLQEGEKQLAEYKVTVQGPVSPVELTVDSVVSRGSDSCNLTVTCSTQHFHISSTFRCVKRTCSQDGGERSELTTSGASLRLYLLNCSIICNHSNQVSTEFKVIEIFCPEPADPDPAVPVHVIVIPIIAILCTIVVVSGLFRYRRKRANHERESIENTVYEIPQVTATAQPQDQSPPDDDSGLSPTSTYSLVGPHTGSLRPTEAGGTALPESLYAQVEKPARSSNN